MDFGFDCMHCFMESMKILCQRLNYSTFYPQSPTASSEQHYLNPMARSSPKMPQRIKCYFTKLAMLIE